MPSYVSSTVAGVDFIRRYIAFFPRDLQTLDAAPPVVLVFHPGGIHELAELGNASSFAEAFPFHTYFNEEGLEGRRFVIVFAEAETTMELPSDYDPTLGPLRPDRPHRANGVWNSGFDDGWGCSLAPDDVGYVDQVLIAVDREARSRRTVDDVEPDEGIDASRVYAFGYSSGANFVTRLLAELPARSAWQVRRAALVSGTNAGALRRGAPETRWRPHDTEHAIDLWVLCGAADERIVHQIPPGLAWGGITSSPLDEFDFDPKLHAAPQRDTNQSAFYEWATAYGAVEEAVEVVTTAAVLGTTVHRHSDGDNTFILTIDSEGSHQGRWDRGTLWVLVLRWFIDPDDYADAD